jgi:hypothetical protein
VNHGQNFSCFFWLSLKTHPSDPILATTDQTKINPMAKNGAMGFFCDHKSSPTRGWAFVPTGLYFLLPVIRINLQVLADSGGMICSLVDSCLFGDTGIESAELDL